MKTSKRLAGSLAASLFFTLLLTSPAIASQEEMANFRGYTEINRVLKERVTGLDTTFELGQYVGEPFEEPPYGTLIELLGQHQTDHDLNDTFRNGQPNPLSMVLWSILISRLSDDIGAHCDPGAHAALALSPRFAEVLAPLCAWPESRALALPALSAYWHQLLGFDAPEAEFLAWTGFVHEEETGRSSSAATAVARITAAALLNPYFLLRN